MRLSGSRRRTYSPTSGKSSRKPTRGTTLSLSIEVVCPPGVPEDTLEKRIVEGFEQLGIAVQWEQG
jgi:hypothetical protein